MGNHPQGTPLPRKPSSLGDPPLLEAFTPGRPPSPSSPGCHRTVCAAQGGVTHWAGGWGAAGLNPPRGSQCRAAGGGGRQSRFKPGHDGTCSPGRKRGGWEQGLLGRGWGGTGGSGGSGGRPSAPSSVIPPRSQCTPPFPALQLFWLRPHSGVRPLASPVPHIPRGAQGQGPPTCGCPAGPDPARGGADLDGIPVPGVCPSPGWAPRGVELPSAPWAVSPTRVGTVPDRHEHHIHPISHQREHHLSPSCPQILWPASPVPTVTITASPRPPSPAPCGFRPLPSWTPGCHCHSILVGAAPSPCGHHPHPAMGIPLGLPGHRVRPPSAEPPTLWSPSPVPVVTVRTSP